MKMNKTVRYILYGVIVAICIISIFIGVYALEFRISGQKNIAGSNAINENETAEELNSEMKVVNDFKALFNNSFSGSNYDSSKIKKMYDDKDIVYNAASLKEKKDEYDIDVNIPLININSDLINKYNDNTQKVFADQVNRAMKNEDSTEPIVCSISYTAYINNNILSVAIMENYKSGKLPQRLIVQTYNYNLDTGEEVTINDVMASRGVDSTSVNKKINSTIKTLAEDDNTIADSGYNVYKRDISSDIYDVKNVKTFMQGPDGELYIIYPYGNTANTSEIDVIKI
jgi:hypothetical protein